MKPTPCRLKFLACSALLASASTGHAQVRWSGATDSDFSKNSNWGTGTAPTTGGTTATRINVGATGNLTPPNALVYSSTQGTTIFNPADRALVIASAGGSVTTATMTISGGTFDSRGSGDDIIANGNAANTGTLNISGGHYTNVNGGSSNLVVGFNGGTANLNISSGSATTGQIVFLTNTAGINTTANIALSGSGILETGGFTRATPGSPAIYNSNISFDGGTLRARGADNANFMTSAVMTGNALVRVGGATINTNGFNIGISKALTQDGTSTGGGLTKTGTGTLTLSGANTYTGATTLNQGTLTVGTGGTLGASTAALSVNNTNSTAAGTDAILNLATAVNTTTGSLSGTIATPTSGTNTATINTQTGRNFTVNQTANGTYAGVIAGAGSFTLGSGSTHTLTLTGTNNYAGATNVNGGTLAVTGSGSINGTSGITVAPGATFRYNSSTALTVGSFTNNGAVEIAGTGSIGVNLGLNSTSDIVSPGNSPGIQPYTVSQTWSSFIYEWETNNFTGITAGTDFDQIAITGDLNLTGAAPGSYVLDLISLTAGNLAGDVPNFSEINRSWNILTTTGSISGFDAGFWTIDTSGLTQFTSDPAWTGSWSLNVSGGNTLVLNYTTVIPEPSAALLGGLGTLLLLRRRRSA